MGNLILQHMSQNLDFVQCHDLCDELALFDPLSNLRVFRDDESIKWRNDRVLLDLIFELVDACLLDGDSSSCLRDSLRPRAVNRQFVRGLVLRKHLLGLHRLGHDKLHFVFVHRVPGEELVQSLPPSLLVVHRRFRGQHHSAGLFNLFRTRPVFQFFQFGFPKRQFRLLGFQFQFDRRGQQLGERLALFDRVTFVDGKIRNATVDSASNGCRLVRHDCRNKCLPRREIAFNNRRNRDGSRSLQSEGSVPCQQRAKREEDRDKFSKAAHDVLSLSLNARTGK